MSKNKASHKKVQKNKRAIVSKYLRDYQKKFKLSLIKFTVSYVRGEKVKDFYAEVLMTGNNVRIRFNEDLMEQRPNEIQDTVVHELLHVLFYKIMNRITNIVNQTLKNDKVKEKQERKFCCLEHEVIEKLVPTLIEKNTKKRKPR